MTNLGLGELHRLTGLSDAELAEVLKSNPRAYMAVKGAVAERHLEQVLNGMVRAGSISGFRAASSDFDKDFYVFNNEGQEFSIECKNVEVIGVSNMSSRIAYFKFLLESGSLEESRFRGILASVLNIDFGEKIIDVFDELNSVQLICLYKALPKSMRESGIYRYAFSANKYSTGVLERGSAIGFIDEIESEPLTIDFQRTRNSTDDDGDNRRGRLYRVGEVDVVAACMFPRTLNWSFIYAATASFEIDSRYADRYASGVKIRAGNWMESLSSFLRG